MPKSAAPVSRTRSSSTLSREKASTLLFNSRGVPEDFARGLDGRYLVVLDGAGNARFSSSPVPQELVQLFERRAPHAVDAPGGTTILAWYASGREWRGAMTYVRPSTPGDPLTANTVVVFAPEATFGSTASELIPTALGLFALTILMAFAVAAIVSERYLPPLRALAAGPCAPARTPLRNADAQRRRGVHAARA